MIREGEMKRCACLQMREKQTDKIKFEWKDFQETTPLAAHDSIMFIT